MTPRTIKIETKSQPKPTVIEGNKAA